VARLGGGVPGGVPGAGSAAGPRWWHALGAAPAPIRNVWVVYLVSLLSLAPDFTGSIDLTIAGHVMAGERFLFVSALAAWSFAIWWAGRWSNDERRVCLYTLTLCVIALLAAPISFEWGSAGWLSHQVAVGMAQLYIAIQLVWWAAAARIERPGVLIMLCGATLELLIFIAVQSGGWDAACDAGLGLTCVEGPWVTNAPGALELLGLILWTDHLIRRGERGGP
jgi:hypothetical protein